MIKKIILCILCLSLVMSLCVFAENETAETVTEPQATQEEMPMQRGRGMGGRMGGGPPGGMGEGMQPPQMPEGESAAVTKEVQPQEEAEPNSSRVPAENFAEQPQPENSGMPDRMQGEMRGEMGEGMTGEVPSDIQKAQNGEGTTQEEQKSKSAGEIIKEYSTPIFSVILLIAAFVFVIFYKRKIY